MDAAVSRRRITSRKCIWGQAILLMMMFVLTLASSVSAVENQEKRSRRRQSSPPLFERSGHNRKNRQAKGGVGEEEEAVAHTTTGYRFERRELGSDNTATAGAGASDSSGDTAQDDLYDRMDADLKLVKQMQQGKFDFFGEMLPQMLDTVTIQEARAIHDNFPFVKKSKAWQDFEANGNPDDAAAVDAAMIASIKEVGQIIPNAAKMATWGSDSMTNTVNEFKDSAETGDPELQAWFDSLEAGDRTAIPHIQQKFADKYLGGIDLDAFQDNDFIDKARENLFANEDLTRLIGDEDILNILRNPELRLKKNPASTDPSRILKDLLGVGTTTVSD